MNLNRRFYLGIWTVKTVLNPISGQVFDAGHDESGVSFLLSGMTAIGWSMESGRRGYGASSGTTGDRPRNLELWSSDERPTPKLTPPILTTTPHHERYDLEPRYI
ncbi:hypothetical protein TNCV_4660851 [Trichonephila clavipes]|uniref:Uncharacterized protein n=1 Tax=Trichonephila clavipes TaxID=2585209 RepID=A0A8X6SCH7_TRICX|nr:hypothetical protein TNCV_4660851 [Trichonephila clavipes]